MKENLRTAEVYLTSQDTNFQKMMVFAKSQGNFFKRVVESLEEQREKHRFIVNTFYRSACQIPSLYDRKPHPEDDTIQPREWPHLPSIMTYEQYMTQDQIRAGCKSIIEGIETNALSEDAIVDFEAGRLTWHGMAFITSHAIVDFEIVSSDLRCSTTDSFYVPFGDRLSAAVYIRNKDGYTRAFLRVKGTDDDEYYFVLKYFSILFLLDEDQRDLSEDIHTEITAGEKTQDTSIVNNNDIEKTVEGNIEDDNVTRDNVETGKIGMFTLFDEAKNLMFVTTY